VRPLLAILAVAVALAGCGSSGDDGTTDTTAAADQATTSGCEKVAKPRPKADGELDRPSLRLGAGEKLRATLQTNCGPIVIDLNTRDQPKTVASFVFLARRGFFDGTTFHRVSRQPDGSDFVVQGGDPTGTGQGGPGYSVTERPPEDTSYTRRVVAMAKTEIEPPGTSGSQFFIVTAEDAQLPPDYAVLGRVAGSDEAVRRLAATPADEKTERPQTPLVIEKVTVSRG
jgi:peptidyl-prolyl cis-trans isomerase B (cyclophilin B)